MTLEHCSGDDGRHYSKWATQVFRAAPPPAVQDWGWPKSAQAASDSGCLEFPFGF